ncbi:MAG TPA: DinB family protein [Gemmatimonadales bacterium]|nr:DinB family protein [Gemmatimonadales bacterium]
MITSDELLAELEAEADATRRVLERVPEEWLDWKPHPVSLTLGQLAMHVATLPGALAEVALRETFPADVEIPRPTAASTDDLLEALERSLDEARDILSRMDAAALAAPWTVVDGGRELFALPRADFLRSTLFNHWYHHRGQLTVYLRIAGAPVPAIYGPSADEAPVFV